MTQEIWKDIAGYEGEYQVSNLGNVKSLERVVVYYKCRNRRIKERILKMYKNKNGYYIVNLSGNIIYVHQIVAMTFLGHKQDGHKLVIDHINNIKEDNRVENLQIVSHRHNLSKDKKGGTSQYVGVSYHKMGKRWQSQITINKKLIYLGCFNNEYDAHLAYQNTLNKIIEKYK